MLAPAVPEIIEDDDIGLAIDARTESLPALRELGPPDLVHLVKQSTKAGAKQTGVYHHVTGVDASSSASLAAYVNTLTFNPVDKTHKVVSGLYCCYNAFSHLDMRVEVKIPGSVESYCVDERGDRRVATDSLWLETFLCAVLRAYSYADDGSGDTIKKIIGVRRFNPVTSTEQEHRFFEAAEKLFFSGRQLGSDPEIQIPNVVSNHLTAGLLKYIKTTGRYASGINLFEKLRTRDVEVSSLLARVLLEGDEEIEAVRLLHDSLQDVPMDYALLDCQASFCQSKGEGGLALELAKQGVTAAPSEFSTWAKLAEVYVDLEQWDLALLTLNSCPMFSYQDKDSPRMPEPSRVLLPILPESALDEIDEGQPRQGEPFDQVHVSLRKLQAATYQGTFLKAYSLLTRIVASIGWDALLKTRSQVFVMEEEYRSERQHSVTPKTQTSKNASTIALSGTPNGHPDAEKPAETEEDESDEESPVDDEKTLAESSTTAPTVNGGGSSENESAEMKAERSMEKPVPTIAAEEVKSGGDDADASSSSYPGFQNKRLCERWLDNLFMVLYEDLRIYTIWRTEMGQYRQQQMQYKKSAAEWEVLGDLAERLHHTNEALEAYQQCLNIRFSPKAMRGILRMYEKKGDTRNILACLIRLITWQYRWYSEFSPELFYSIRKLIEEEGAVKVRSIVQSTNLPQPVLDLTHEYCQVCVAFRSNGTDA
ncbi:bud site selection protein [Elasticomyces elasticus]|uniref:Bud site selection protein n=1 Tax=Exophiala sideris TaxID=1016849 RepID=A0ABR0J5W2_9EURO|nr:bud site selection protein [Elasticomyces elasticus]KAK5028330.1 bud site selection protein [Exophiala sideris]KAK5036026.1 bud site selection protein [Exophiala sideris]KAK5057063.1 bud site selection protein [Exophiala sideris]KAK5181470.1 bud site selection protein [Eurotiomycetes sp. CCFEE 6388]